MRIAWITLPLSAVLLLSSAVLSGGDPAGEMAPARTWTYACRGKERCLIEGTELRRITDAASWEELWDRHKGGFENPPDVDFVKEMVLACFFKDCGTLSGMCHDTAIHFSSLRREDSCWTLSLKAEGTTAEYGCQNASVAWIGVFPRIEGEIRVRAGKVEGAIPAGSPPLPLRAEEIPGLVRQLGDERYARREEAALRLRLLARRFPEAIRASADDPDAEIRESVRAILDEIWAPYTERPRTWRGICRQFPAIPGPPVKQGAGRKPQRFLRLATEEEWAAFWRETFETDRKVPRIDFSREMVLACMLGPCGFLKPHETDLSLKLKWSDKGTLDAFLDVSVSANKHFQVPCADLCFCIVVLPRYEGEIRIHAAEFRPKEPYRILGTIPPRKPDQAASPDGPSSGRPCPHCGAKTSVVPIYGGGIVGSTPEEMVKIKKGEAVAGGGCTSGYRGEKWHCKRCRRSWK